MSTTTTLQWSMTPLPYCPIQRHGHSLEQFSLNAIPAATNEVCRSSSESNWVNVLIARIWLVMQL